MGLFRQELGNQVLQTFRIFPVFHAVTFNRLDDQSCVHMAQMSIEHEGTENGKNGQTERQRPDAILCHNGTLTFTAPEKRRKVGQHKENTKEGAEAWQPYK